MSNTKSKKAPTQRQRRVAEEIRHIIGMQISKGDFTFEDFPLITLSITEVSIGPDLRNATIFLSSITKDALKEAVVILNKNAGYFKKHLSQNLPLKFIPSLHFKYDDRQDHVDKINSILSKINTKK